MKYFQSLKTMVLYTYMIWTVIFKDLSSTSHVQEPMIFWLFQLHLDTLFWFGHKIRMIQQEKVTMVNILSNTFVFTKEKIVNLFQSLITKFKTLNGHKMVNSSSLFLGNNPLWLQCMILMVNQHLNSESNSGTLFRFVHLVPS